MSAVGDPAHFLHASQDVQIVVLAAAETRELERTAARQQELGLMAALIKSLRPTHG